MISSIRVTYKATKGPHKKEKLKKTRKEKLSSNPKYDKKLITKSVAEQISVKLNIRLAKIFCFLNAIKKASPNRLKIERMFITEINAEN